MAITLTLKCGKRYQATVQLSGVEAWASNEDVAEKFMDLGFTEVEVVGEDEIREGTALWPHADRKVRVPDQVRHIAEVTDDGNGGNLSDEA